MEQNLSETAVNTPPSLKNLDTPVSPEMNTSPSVPVEPILKKRRLLFFSLFVVFVLLLGIGTYFAVRRLNRQSPTVSNEQKETPVSPELSDKSILVGSFRIFVPTDWTVSISTKTTTVLAARFYPNGTNKETTYLEVQVGPTDLFSTNNTISFVKESMVTAPTSYVIREGNETLMKSERKVLQLEKTVSGEKLVLTLYGTSGDIVEQGKVVEKIMEQVISKQTLRLVKTVYAQEQTTPEASPSSTIAGFALSQWKTIEIMEGPYPERITSTDYQYKDGYARLYKFTALPGQRLEILAEEAKDSLQQVGSFIESELYDQNGQLILKAQTRLSISELFLQNYSGTYYLLVKSFQQKEGKFLLKIFDLDQVNDIYSLRYSDGSEVQLTGQPNFKSLPAVIIVRLTNPVEIINNYTFRYFRKPDNTCIDCVGSSFLGDKTIPINVKLLNGEEIPIKMTKIFLNQILIQPASQESFDVGKSYEFNLDYGHDPQTGIGGGYRGLFQTFK